MVVFIFITDYYYYSRKNVSARNEGYESMKAWKH